MDLEGIVIDPIHIFCEEEYEMQNPTNPDHFQVVKHKDTQKKFYLIKRGENFNYSTKSSFIFKIENSFKLIHPAIINLSGYSITKPYLYYKYSQSPLYINDIDLTDTTVQIIFLGIASGLSYLLSKSYYISNFSIKSVIFDKIFYPKLIDYINLPDINETHKKDSIVQYSQFIQEILNKKTEENSSISINDELKALIERCNSNDNIPTFEDFINFFKKKSYRDNLNVFKDPSFSRYCQILDFADKIIYDSSLSQEEVYSYVQFESIEKICHCFLSNNKEIKQLDQNDENLLNSLPEHNIIQLAKCFSPLTEKFKRYIYSEDISLVIPGWNKLAELEPFQLYQALLSKMQELVKEKQRIDFYHKKAKEYEYKIEAIRIKAIELLKDAYKNSEDVNIKIELAVQYVKGDLLPYNVKKALRILTSISTDYLPTKTLVKGMINTLKQSDNDNIRDAIPADQIKIFNKAEKNDILSMLFVAFSLYTGFNGFPIRRSLSIQYYRKAAELSPNAMMLQGYLYYNGIFFPQNLKRARNCFLRASEKGCYKAEIINCILRKHVWRSYLIDYDVNDLFSSFLPQHPEKEEENDFYCFARINYYLNTHISDVKFYDSKIVDSDIHLNSDKENHSMKLALYTYDGWEKKIKPAFSENVLLFPTEKKDPLSIGKNYYYGMNGYPVNYTEAAKNIKISADSGNAEAQWRYAMLCIDAIGVKYDVETAKQYLIKSMNQNNIQGKFHYSFLALKSNEYEDIMKDCINKKHLDAMYYYGMHLEKKDEDEIDFEKVIEIYKKASDEGHFDSFLRLINLYENQSKKELFEENLLLSVGILNENLLIKLIELLDEQEKYKQSNILIDIGIKLNPKKFDCYFADHLLYGKGIKRNIERALNLMILTIRENQNYILQESLINDNEIPDQFIENIPDKFIYLMLQAYAINNEHGRALAFLLKFQKRIDVEHRKEYHLFYQNFDPDLAHHFLIPPYFYYDDFKVCHDLYMEHIIKDSRFNNYFLALLSISKGEAINYFAIALIGKAYKQGKHMMRNLKTAIKYFECSARNKCPLGYYYIAKEFYYGRYIDQDCDNALKYFNLAIENNDVPRAGYYIFKISVIYNKKNDKCIKFLKIAADFGHKRALYKYGHLLFTGKNPGIPQNKEKGIELIQKASYQKYKKAIQFCLLHRISFKETKDDSDSSVEEDAHSRLTKILNEIKEQNNGTLVNRKQGEITYEKNEEL